MMTLRDIYALLIIILLNFVFWGYPNIPVSLSETQTIIDSLSFNPYQINQDPMGNNPPQSEDIDRDMSVVSQLTRTIRLYGSDPWFEKVPELAKKHKLDVVASAWIDQRMENNDKQLEALIHMAGFNRNVKRVIVGNETQLHALIPPETLKSYLEIVRKKLKTPASTAEPWDFWIRNPEWINSVDYIAIHVLPYWQGIPIEQAVDYVISKYQAVKAAYPNKFVYLSETGWPSDGPQRGEAVASLVNQARFVRDFIGRAHKLNIPYNLVEAFDQPWKSANEGRAGEHWGIWDAYRQLKFPIHGAVVENSHWRLWAFSSAFLSFFAGGILLIRKRKLRFFGKIIMILVVQIIATAACLLANEATREYISGTEIVFWTVMVTAQIVVSIIFITDSAEIADVVGRRPLQKNYPLSETVFDEGSTPFVSIHLACCKEPPELVIDTIDSLSRMNYANFEVIVVDNNTPDPKLWEPVQKRCEELGERFQFFSLGKWPGFKAGALNYAIKQTNPKAKIVGVVDADYVVEPNWLSATIPHFHSPDVAVVQCPQEHRDWERNTFLKMENDEFTGFFRIGMVQRNEYNAIVQHGTMTLIHHEMLKEVGGWSEWCISEDTELGLRLLIKGKKCIYINRCLGRGLVPDSFEAYSKQRFRWAFGGARIFRRYIAYLFGLKKGLTPQQRYRFLRDWLSWGIGSFLHMAFTVSSLVWTGVLLADPEYTDFPQAVFVYPAIGLLLIKIFGVILTYRERVSIGFRRTFFAMLAGASLTHSVAKAVFQGLFLPFQLPFLRTPKLAKSKPLLRSLVVIWQEWLLLTLLWVGAYFILHTFTLKNDEARLWSIVLVIQSIPYLASLLVSVISSFSSGKETAPV